MPIINKFALALSCAVLAPLFLLAILYFLGLRQESRAHGFLSDVQTLNLGSSTFADAERLANRYGGKPWTGIQPSACTREKCFLRFEFPNPRNFAPFFSKVLFGGLIHVKDGKVVGVETFYESDSRAGPWVSYDLRETSVDRSMIEHANNPWEYAGYEWESAGFAIRSNHVVMNGVPWVVEVLLGKNATNQERARSFSINLACLATLSGCRTPSALVPAEIFKLAASRAQSAAN